MIHTPPGKGRETEMPGVSQETGKIIDLTEFTITEIKEILKGEGVSDKGKIKADYVQRLQKYAVEQGDENYTFVLEKYPHIVKRTPPIMNIGNNKGDDIFGSGERVVPVKPTTSIESRVGNMESEMSHLGKMMEKMVRVMTDVQTRLNPQNQPSRVSNADISVPPHHVMVQSRSDLPSDQMEMRDIIIEKSTQEKMARQGNNKGDNDLIDWESNETKIPSTQGVTSELPTRYTDGNPVNAENGVQGNDSREYDLFDRNSVWFLTKMSPSISDGTPHQNILMMQMFQQIMHSQQQQSREQAEDRAQMMQIMKVLMNERVVANVPSPPPKVRFDQNAPTICEGDGRNEGNADR